REEAIVLSVVDGDGGPHRRDVALVGGKLRLLLDVLEHGDGDGGDDGDDRHDHHELDEGQALLASELPEHLFTSLSMGWGELHRIAGSRTGACEHVASLSNSGADPLWRTGGRSGAFRIR